jgi:hypothetical protein
MCPYVRKFLSSDRNLCSVSIFISPHFVSDKVSRFVCSHHGIGSLMPGSSSLQMNPVLWPISCAVSSPMHASLCVDGIDIAWLSLTLLILFCSYTHTIFIHRLYKATDHFSASCSTWFFYSVYFVRQKFHCCLFHRFVRSISGLFKDTLSSATNILAFCGRAIKRW